MNQSLSLSLCLSLCLTHHRRESWYVENRRKTFMFFDLFYGFSSLITNERYGGIGDMERVGRVSPP